MLIEIFKFIGSILLGTGIAVVFVARMHRTSKTIDKPIPFISYYKIDDDINEYEKYIKEDESIEEDTPGGKVFMIYNKDTEQFDYYSNNVIPYRYLEVVARKYVLTYNCLELYIDTKEEYIKLLKESKESEESEIQPHKEEGEEGEEESPIDDVFVQYKSYNKQSYKSNNKSKPIKTKIIVFKRMGMLYEYLEKKKDKTTYIKKLSFGEYKNKVS